MSAAESELLTGPEDLDAADREVVEALLFRLADDELVVAERYTEWQVHAPSLESDISLANVAQDELGHARLWYNVLKPFGYDETDLIWERATDDFRHATLVELPYETGDWADAVLRGYLYDVAEDLRMASLANSTYRPIRDRVGKVQAEETYHLQYAESWLERLAADDEGRERLQAALDRLYPHALTLFAPEDDRVVELGLRDRPLAVLRGDWDDRVLSFLEGLGLSVPDIPADAGPFSDDPAPEVPSTPGRDGPHTEHWATLHDDMTTTYRELGRDHATTIIDHD